MDDQSQTPRQVRNCIRHRESPKRSRPAEVDTVTKRELNRRTASVLDRVTDAGDLVVTERGRPRWRISSLRQDAPSTPPAAPPGGRTL